jgi:hypothetical protein
MSALVAGFGAFAFCRRVLKLSYWPSALAAWCYPITGWFVLFQGFPACIPVVWLPWSCYAIDRTIQGAKAGAIGLAVVTGLVLVSGNLDVAGQVLLVSGLFALWRTWDVHRRRCVRHLAGKGGLVLVLGWTLGFLLAAPYILPLQEYTRTSDRISRRGRGVEERPPVGILALPQLVLPDMYGTYAEKGTCPLLEPVESNQLESPAICYTGLLATLLLAPWALLCRRRRSASIFFLSLAGFGASWALNVPGVVQILRLPGLNLMSHNRLVFATSFAILALAAMGLESLLEGELSRRPRLWLQAGLLAVLLGWCLYRTSVFPEPLASEFESRVEAGDPDIWVSTIPDVRVAQEWFSRRYQRAAALCAAGLAIWLFLHYRPSAGRRLFPIVGALLVGDLLLFGHGKRILQDPAIYYPEVPALRDIAAAAPGRMLGIGCLPANLAQSVGLNDIRGFDSVDPYRWLALLSVASAKKEPDFDYAAAQWFIPSIKTSPPDTVELSPVLDMLAVRYAVFRGIPEPDMKPRFQSPDYWVLENRSALPRAFVPQRVEATTSEEETLRKLALPEFNARQVAYVETELALPAAIRGAADIREETPTRIEVDARMDTPGLLVLADNWDKGWQAYVNGSPMPIQRTNYTIRGVVLPAGPSKVEFRYESKRVALGHRLAAAAIAILLVWTARLFRRWRKAAPGVLATSN